MAFEASIQYKTVSKRGNTKPKHVIDMIKYKRKLENGIRKHASDTRKRKEEAYTKIFSLVETPITYHYSEEAYKYWNRNLCNFKTKIHSLARKINNENLKIWAFLLPKL